MRGVRVSALRNEFWRQHGRAPRKSSTEKTEALGLKGWRDIVKVAPSRWRKMIVKKVAPDPDDIEAVVIAAYEETLPPVLKNTVTEMFLRRIFGMVVIQPSEWRQLKKAYQRAKAAGKG